MLTPRLPRRPPAGAPEQGPVGRRLQVVTAEHGVERVVIHAAASGHGGGELGPQGREQVGHAGDGRGTFVGAFQRLPILPPLLVPVPRHLHLDRAVGDGLEQRHGRRQDAVRRAKARAVQLQPGADQRGGACQRPHRAQGPRSARAAPPDHVGHRRTVRVDPTGQTRHQAPHPGPTATRWPDRQPPWPEPLHSGPRRVHPTGVCPRRTGAARRRAAAAIRRR